ncbi:MAG TPA: sodium:calcium antiporter [Methanocella sp.]|nr:sodium:calcium antiporter [Methanocella sp.]
MDILVFLLSFFVILASCELFTNGVEWVGKRFCLSEGAIGSLLAAIGTALPETILPLIAILIIGGETGHEIGAGAILGAPFMLSTLALLVCGLSVIVFARRRRTKALHINSELVRRDLRFFLFAFALAAVSAFVPLEFGFIKPVVGISLLLLYIVYSYLTLKTGETLEDSELNDLYLSKAILKCTPARLKARREPGEPGTFLIIVQVVSSLAGIILGAYLFVAQINDIALSLGINPLLLSLIISPIATELPEKFNSMVWIRERKDTFAIGNITGAMVFQSCIPVAIGILMTEWHMQLTDRIQSLEALSIGIALLSALILYWRSGRKEITASGLLIGGALYLIFIGAVLMVL